MRIGYITDVEGNLDYVTKYASASRVLKVVHDARPFTLDLVEEDDDDDDNNNNNNTHFVFGGDAIDKGPGDLRLLRALVDLKRRYPRRVHLLVGNRDLNKLRLKAELGDQDMAARLEEIPPPHWDPAAPSLLEYLQHESERTGNSIEQLNTRVNRLHYLLKHTLGCPKTFDFRRQELELLSGGTTRVSDEQVCESFLEQLEPGGALWDYLELAQVAVVLGNTLFCHGAVDRNTMRFVPRPDTRFENPPSRPPPFKMIDSLHDWVQALNEYLKQGLQDFRQRPDWNLERTSRGGEALMALQNRPAMWGRSIVSNSYGDGGCITTDHAARIRNDPDRKALEATNPLVFEKVSSDPADPVVANWLLRHGVQRVVVGHKPTGDCPAVLSATYTGVEIVSGDTSFSDVTVPDNRGVAVGVVEIVGPTNVDNQLELSGVLRCGQTYHSRFCRLHPGGVDTSVGDARLGRRGDKTSWWIKASDTDTYFLARGKGRSVETTIVPKSLLCDDTTNIGTTI